MVKVNVLGSKMVLRILRAPRFNKPYTLASPPPWDKTRGGTGALSDKQQEVVKAFKKVASATKGMPLSQRMEVVKRVLKGADFGGAKRIRYSPKPKSEVDALVSRLKSELGLA